MTEIEKQKLIGKAIQNFPYYPNKEDLFQVGYIGIMNAEKNYKEGFDTKFSSYAYFYILGEMKKLTREDRPLKVSRSITKLTLKIEKMNVLLTQKLGRVPTVVEIADALGIDERIITDALTSKMSMKSMDEQVNLEGKEMCYHELISDKQKDIDLLIDLKNSLQKLSREEHELIRDLYFRERTQAEVAEELHTSQVQVSRKKEKVLEKIRKDMTYC